MPRFGDTKKRQLFDEAVAAVRACDGHRGRAAARLGISPRALGGRLRWYPLPRPLPRDGRNRRAEPVGVLPPGQPQPIAEAWADYARNRCDLILRNRLVEHYLPWCRQVVGVRFGAAAAHWGLDVLLSYAMVGLIGQVERFDPARAIKFETFAFARVVGSVLDGLRHLDRFEQGLPVARTLRQREKTQRAAAKYLADARGRRPTDDEVGLWLGWTSQDLADSRVTSVASLETTLAGRHGPRTLGETLGSTAGDPARARERKRYFTWLTRSLDFEERVALYLRFCVGHDVQAVGSAMGVSESRASQRISAALKRLAKTVDREAALEELPRR